MPLNTPPAGVTPAILVRIKARRARLRGDGPDFAPLPAPAHDLLAELAAFAFGCGPEPAWWDAHDLLRATLLHAMLLAEHAGTLADRSGKLRHGQLAEEALDHALDWARELARVLPARDGEGPAPAPPGTRRGGAP